MAIANPLRGERRPGRVGQPLPGVEVRLVDEARTAGRRQGRRANSRCAGSTVFAEYWRRPDATREAFRDGWFRTGDRRGRRRRRLPAARPHQHRHHQDRRLQDLRAGNRGRAARASGDRRMRRRRHRRRGVGPTGVCGGRAEGCRDVDARAEFEPWARERLAPYKIPRSRSRPCPPCLATRWARSSSPRSSRCSKSRDPPSLASFGNQAPFALRASASRLIRRKRHRGHVELRFPYGHSC